MSQLQPRRSLKPIVNPRRWNRIPITPADAIAGELVQMHEEVLNERDELVLDKQELENKCHQFETQTMRDEQKIMGLERQIKELTKDNDQLRSQAAELKNENSSLKKVDTMPVVRHSYLDEDDSFNFIVDAYDRRNSHDISGNQNDEHGYQQAIQMAVALIAKEAATNKREVHHLTLLAQRQDVLIHKLEERLENQLAISHQRARASNLMLLEDMERNLRQDSIQALHERQQLEMTKPEKEQEDFSKLNVYTSMPDPPRHSIISIREDFETETSRRTSGSSAISRRKSRSIPPATPPPREPLPPLPLRESYTSSSTRTSLSSVQSYSVSSPTTYSSSEWEKSRSSLHSFQADLHNTTSKGEGETHPEVTRSRSGFWRGLRSKMATKH